MIVQVGEGESTGPDGTKQKVRIITFADGQLQHQVILQLDQAKELAAALDGRKVVAAAPGEVLGPDGKPKT
jgi:hypothetical protein